MSEPILEENIISLGHWLQYWMSQYSSMRDYETQTGALAEPTTTSKGNGHEVAVYNSTQDRLIVYTRCNGDAEWRGVEAS